MKQHEKDRLVARIKCGYLRIKIGEEKLKVVAFSDDLLYEAEELYQEIYEDSLYEGFLDRELSLFYLNKKGLFTVPMLKEIEKLEKEIENKKVDVYKSFYQSVSRERERSILREKEERLLQLLEKKNSWEHATLEGLASFARWQFLIENSTYYLNGEKYDWSKSKISDVLTAYQKSLLDEKTIRELVKSEPWSTQWSLMKKTNNFPSPPFTIDQQNIILWSSFYDSIHEAYEPPSKDIIEDNDALDGWSIIKKREASKGTTQKKEKNYDEVFMMAETIEDAKRIQDLNSGYGKSVIANRTKKVQDKGSIKYHEFDDIKHKRKILEAGLN